MQASPELPEPWPDFLSELDKGLSRPVELHCVGGFILTALHGIPRPTGDLDYITVAPRDASEEVERLAGRDSELAHKYKLYVQYSGGVIDLPEGYDERLIALNLGLSNLHLKALEPYDLILSKLTRGNPKDREDVKYLAKRCKLSFQTLFDRFASEMQPWVPNPDRHESVLINVWQDYFSA